MTKGGLILGFIVALSAAAQSPIAITATAAKARVLLGEGIVINLHMEVSAPFEMEPVELNRDRTTIAIDPLSMTLSGQDYISLHHRNPLEGFGHAFRPKAGAAWNTQLKLLNYAKPLPPGKHRITISYRWGKSPSEVLRTNPVEVTVAPAKLIYFSSRWMGGATPREQLASLWSADDNGKLHWFYTVADKEDPSVLISSIDLGAANMISPRLAHINGIAQSQFERIAVWVDRSRLCWWRINDSAPPDTGPSCADLPFDSTQTASLADPPLQLQNGGLAVAATGIGRTGPASTWVLVGRDGKTSIRNEPSPSAKPAVVIWNEDEARPRGELYFASEGKPVQSQWLGLGSAFEVYRRGNMLEARTLTSPQRDNALSVPLPAACAIEDAAAPELAVLCRISPTDVAVITPKGIRRLKSTGAHIVAGPQGLRLLEFNERQGFVTLPYITPIR